MSTNLPPFCLLKLLHHVWCQYWSSLSEFLNYTSKKRMSCSLYVLLLFPCQETSRSLQLQAAALPGKLQTQTLSSLQRCKWTALQYTVGYCNPLILTAPSQEILILFDLFSEIKRVTFAQSTSCVSKYPRASIQSWKFEMETWKGNTITV